MNKLFVVAIISLIWAMSGSAQSLDAPPAAVTSEMSIDDTSKQDALGTLIDAARQGDTKLQATLGHMYESGDGVTQDYKEAAKWYRMAADNGDADAQCRLGVLNSSGEGMPQDFKAAAKWYSMAADYGYADAQLFLGIAYSAGDGVPQDYVQAHKWVNLAISNYPPDADLRAVAVRTREALSSFMTPAQIAEAQKLASEWKPLSAKQ